MIEGGDRRERGKRDEEMMRGRGGVGRGQEVGVVGVGGRGSLELRP